jgi:hypothetical protein
VFVGFSLAGLPDLSLSIPFKLHFSLTHGFSPSISRFPLSLLFFLSLSLSIFVWSGLNEREIEGENKERRKKKEERKKRNGRKQKERRRRRREVREKLKGKHC